MSSIHVLNKGTDNKRGLGLPFYDNLNYIFSKSNVDFNSTNGLWSTPNERIPTFQLWQEFPNLISLTYKSTKGNNMFVPGNDIVYLPGTFLTVKAVVTNGIQEYIISSLPNVALSPIPPNGKWIIELVVGGVLQEKTFYSEEFVTKDCC